MESVLDSVGPVQYHPRKTANTRPADAALILSARSFSRKLLRRESGASQHAIDRFFRGERIHPGTRKKLAEAVEKLRLGVDECVGDLSSTDPLPCPKPSRVAVYLLPKSLIRHWLSDL